MCARGSRGTHTCPVKMCVEAKGRASILKDQSHEASWICGKRERLTGGGLSLRSFRKAPQDQASCPRARMIHPSNAGLSLCCCWLRLDTSKGLLGGPDGQMLHKSFKSSTTWGTPSPGRLLLSTCPVWRMSLGLDHWPYLKAVSKTGCLIFL